MEEQDSEPTLTDLSKHGIYKHELAKSLWESEGSHALACEADETCEDYEQTIKALQLEIGVWEERAERHLALLQEFGLKPTTPQPGKAYNFTYQRVDGRMRIFVDDQEVPTLVVGKLEQDYITNVERLNNIIVTAREFLEQVVANFRPASSSSLWENLRELHALLLKEHDEAPSPVAAKAQLPTSKDPMEHLAAAQANIANARRLLPEDRAEHGADTAIRVGRVAQRQLAEALGINSMEVLPWVDLLALVRKAKT